MAEKKNGESGDGRVTLIIPSTKQMNNQIAAWLLRHGGSKTRLLERIISFFSNSPEHLQYIMAGAIPEDMRPEYAKRAAEFFKSLEVDPSAWPEVKESDAPEEEFGAKKPRLAAKKKNEP